jgi:60S ribosomal subunit assembly/export protein LOC1
MAPRPPSSSGSGSRSSKGKPGSDRKSSNHNPKARKSATAGPPSKSGKVGKRPPAKQVKTRPGVHSNTADKGGKSGAPKPKQRKQKTYTDKELDLPALNMITPVGQAAATAGGGGKKKNKIFVDDRESMMTILAMVNAEKEGQIESKMIKARQMEEIREARRREMEKKQQHKQAALEEVKKGLKKGNKKKGPTRDDAGDKDHGDASTKPKKTKKKVSFA